MEIKLTVLPDSTTVKKSEDQWSSEMVLRPLSSSHAMMGVATSLKSLNANQSLKKKVVAALKPAYNAVGVSGWDHKTQILQEGVKLCDALIKSTKIIESIQRPFLIQPYGKQRDSLLILANIVLIYLYGQMCR